jgi:hypothetical protein
MKKEKDTYSYVGWLSSDNFVKRALAIFGYGIMGLAIIYVMALIVFFVIGILMGISY